MEVWSGLCSSEARSRRRETEQADDGLIDVGEAVNENEESSMHELIYLIGLIVVIMAILSFFGLR
jgi:hypothetical protein